MTTLTLASIEAAVAEAFEHWLDQKPEDVIIELENKEVKVTIVLRDNNSFDCGIPGYNMANADEAALREWVPNNIEKNGNKGTLAACKNGTVNVWLKGGVYVMFNFHVNLVGPCT